MRSKFIELQHATKSERDRQVKIGPSTAGSTCDRCVWRALSATSPSESGPYWLGAAIGTGVHMYLAEMSARAGETEETVLIERKVTIGELEGYGTIKGSIDRFDIHEGIVRDWKGMYRKDKKALREVYANDLQPVEGEPQTHKKMRNKLLGYYGQAHLYGLGLENEGFVVNDIAIEFFCRDGVGDDDITVVGLEYDPKFARAMWRRLEHIWTHMDDEYESHPECFPCGME